jgi:hypothetical protein
MAFLKSYPKAAYMSEVKRWRDLPDGAIEFIMRRLKTADRWPPKTKSWRSYPNGLSKSARRGRFFAWRLLRTTTLAGLVAKSPSSPRTRKGKPGRSPLNRTVSGGIGAILNLLSPKTWKRRKHASSATRSFAPKRWQLGAHALRSAGDVEHAGFWFVFSP